MGEAAMVGKAKYRTLEIPQDVDVRGFRRQRHRGRSQRRPPIEPGTGQAGSGKKVSKRFQSLLYSHVWGGRSRPPPLNLILILISVLILPGN